jgi:hypothetical protein
MMAAGFERLADQVEKWENASLAARHQQRNPI